MTRTTTKVKPQAEICDKAVVARAREMVESGFMPDKPTLSILEAAYKLTLSVRSVYVLVENGTLTSFVVNPDPDVQKKDIRISTISAVKFQMQREALS